MIDTATNSRAFLAHLLPLAADVVPYAQEIVNKHYEPSKER